MPKVCKNKDPCSICLKTPRNKASIGCSHEFCRKCIVKWSKTENSCPICRQEFTYVKTAKSKTNIKRQRQMSQEETRRNFIADIVSHFLLSNRFKVIFMNTIEDAPLDIRLIELVEAMYVAYNDPGILTEVPNIENELEFAKECIGIVRNNLIDRVMSRATVEV